MSYQLVTVIGALTKNKTPYLRLIARTGESVSVFNNTFMWTILHREYPELAGLQVEQRLTWEEHPICVEMLKDAKDYWQITSIAPRSEHAVPDVPFTPDLASYRQSAVWWAKTVLESAPQIVVFDMETTTNDKLKAEPLSVGLYKPPFTTRLGDTKGGLVVDTLVKPLNLRAVTENTGAAEVHKITPEMLANAPEFLAVSQVLVKHFQQKLIMGYNLAFDLTVLHRACARHGLVPITPLAVIDALEPVSWFMGEWNVERQSFTYKSLEDAAAHFKLEFGDAHNALADCKMTWRVVEAMANS